MVKCPGCGKWTVDEEKCDGCGKVLKANPNDCPIAAPSKVDYKGCFSAIGTILVFVVSLRACYQAGWFSAGSEEKSKATKETSKTVASIGDYVPITRGNFYGFVLESDLDKISEYLVAKDEEAFEKAMMVLLLSDMAIPLQKGDMVYIVDRNVWNHTVKIRKKGELTEYWAFKQVVEQ